MKVTPEHHATNMLFTKLLTRYIYIYIYIYLYIYDIYIYIIIYTTYVFDMVLERGAGKVPEHAFWRGDQNVPK